MSNAEDFAKKLAPETIRRGLVHAGLFLAGWELLKAECVEKVRSFFVVEFDENGPLVDDSYQQKVLSRHKHRLEASLLWLLDSNALTPSQAESIRAIQKHRNELAHELPTFMVDPSRALNEKLLTEMNTLIAVLGRFWGRVEVDIHPDFEGAAVDDAEIQSGSMLLMQHLLDVARAS